MSGHNGWGSQRVPISRLPSISTDANQGRQYLEANGAGTGIVVKSTTVLQVGGRLAVVDADTEVTTLDTGVLTLGTDYYVYAVHSGAGIAFVLSANTTYPTGYSAGTSRKIGGFHYGRVRALANRYNRNAVLPVQVVPNSVWDLFNRPRSAPEGMVKVANLWVDIYLSSENGAAWPDTAPLSKYNATPLSGTEGYSYYDYGQLAGNAGKRLPRYAEWLRAAFGVPEGSVGGSARIATGGAGYTLPGASSPASSQYYWVSCYGLDQPSGNLWQACADYFDMYNGTTSANGAYSWTNITTGKDGDVQGSIYAQFARQLIAGGRWGDGAGAGGRCAGLSDPPWNVGTSVGLRCVSDSL